MNQTCEELVKLYGVLQECAHHHQFEKKAAFDAALAKFASEQNIPNDDKLRAFVIRKWNQWLIAENKRSGKNLGGGLKT